ncbi:MAG: hypothetical protein MZV63_23445 [Marinilabiliales bacterium]|nr:hypothetical protein [Marinilabiliales bacterium]
MCDALRHTLADISEMGCLALYHTAQADDPVKIVILGKPLGSARVISKVPGTCLTTMSSSLTP